MRIIIINLVLGNEEKFTRTLNYEIQFIGLSDDTELTELAQVLFDTTLLTLLPV